jgi:hypothetical protein
VRMEETHQHDEEICNLYSAPNVVMVIVSRVRWPQTVRL